MYIGCAKKNFCYWTGKAFLSAEIIWIRFEWKLWEWWWNECSILEGLWTCNFCLGKHTFVAILHGFYAAETQLFGLIFPALEKYPALYDRWEMWITLIWLFVYLMVGTQGSVLRKVTAAVVARAVLMMVNTAILFGGSFILQESVASFIQDQDTTSW